MTKFFTVFGFIATGFWLSAAMHQANPTWHSAMKWQECLVMAALSLVAGTINLSNLSNWREASRA